MLDKETIKNISTFVEITMRVEERLRAKYEQKEEQLTEDLEDMTKECSDFAKQVYELNGHITDLEGRVEELTGQKDRQAAKITELKEVRESQEKLICDLRKEIAVKEVTPSDLEEELRQKLDKAMDHIRRQGEEIDKLRAGAADPRWIPLTSRYPDMNENVLACTKRGTIYIAQETDEGWKNSTGKMAEPVAWMPLPVRYTGGEE